MTTPKLLDATPRGIIDHLTDAGTDFTRNAQHDAILINLCERIELQDEIIAEFKTLIDRVDALLLGGVK